MQKKANTHAPIPSFRHEKGARVLEENVPLIKNSDYKQIKERYNGYNEEKIKGTRNQRAAASTLQSISGGPSATAAPALGPAEVVTDAVLAAGGASGAASGAAIAAGGDSEGASRAALAAGGA